MDFSMNSEQKMIQRTVREFMNQEVESFVEKMDREDEFPMEIYIKMAEMNLFGVLTPEEYGGVNMGTVSWCLILEEEAKVCPAIAVLNQNQILQPECLLNFGTEEQKRKFIPPIVTGEKMGAYVLTEANAGSDLAAIRTRADKDGDHYLLNGTKTFITLAKVCGLALVLAKTNPEEKHRGISAFMVDAKSEGFKCGKHEDYLGMRGLGSSEVYFTDCRVPQENLIGGEENQGFYQIMKSLGTGRVGVAALSLGIAQRCLDESVKFAQEREQFGRPIAKFQAIQFILADMAAQIEAVRCLTYKAATLRDQGQPFEREASMAKLLASDLAMECATQAIQIHGGYGYTKDYPVERFFRDAKITQIFEGTNQIQRLVISRGLLKQV